jgi:hypothetical protein
MMKTLTLLAVALVAPMWAADEAPKLPPAIQAIVEKAEAEVSKNQKVYDTANSKSLDAAEKSLKAELETMTKAGKLDEAMAAKKTLESVRADVVARVDEQAKDNGGLLGDDGVSATPKLADWDLRVWQGNWNTLDPKPFIKQVRTALSFTNNTGIHSFCHLQTKREFKGDFEVSVRFSGQARGVGLYPQSGEDRAIFASLTSSTTGEEMRSVVMRRSKGVVEIAFDGTSMPAQVYRSTQDAAGCFGFDVVSGSSISIHSFYARDIRQ